MKFSAISIAVVAFVALIGLSSCEKTYDNPAPTPINAAIKSEYSNITAVKADVQFSSEQTNLACIKYVPAKEYPAKVDYLSMSSTERLDYIEQNGKEVSFPNKVTMKGLKARTTYSVAYIGIDANGTVRTAPLFSNFETEYAACDVYANFTTKTSPYTMLYNISPNESVKNYKYIISQDAAVIAKSDDELKTYVMSNGTSATGAKSATKDFTSSNDVILAVVAYDEDGGAGDLSYDIATTQDIVYFCYNNKETKLKRTGTIYEGTFNVEAVGSFKIKINGVEYGFMQYSGNGGVGNNTNSYTSSPYYEIGQYITQGLHSDQYFFVNESLGRMDKMPDGQMFWINQAAAGKLKVRVDLTTPSTPHYYLKWVETATNIVLKQSFDLFSYGGYYMYNDAKNSATSYPGGYNADITKLTGTEQGTPSGLGGGGTDYGVCFAYYPSSAEPVTPSGKVAPKLAPAKYITNKGLTGWTLVNFSEFSGNMFMGGVKGYATTPKLTALTSATAITVEYDFINYGSKEPEKYTVELTGAGTITSAQAVDCGVTKNLTSQISSDKKTLLIPQGTCTMYAVGAKNKAYTHVTLKVSGATSTTQVTFNFGYVGGEAGRFLIDNILITK